MLYQNRAAADSWICGNSKQQAISGPKFPRQLKVCTLGAEIAKAALQKVSYDRKTLLFETRCDFGAPPTPHSELPRDLPNRGSGIPRFAHFGAPIVWRGGTLADHLTHLGCSPGSKEHPRHKFFEIEVTWGIEKRPGSAPAKQ